MLPDTDSGRLLNILKPLWLMPAFISDAISGPGSGQRGGEAHHGGHQDWPVDRAAGDQDDDDDYI